jgi:hypothetical protein
MAGTRRRIVDELDKRITDLVQVLNRPINDGFDEKIVARIERRVFFGHAVLLLVAFIGLAISVAPITQLMVAISDRLIGAPAEIPEMAGSYSFALSGIVSLALLFWVGLLRRLGR